MKTIYSVYGKNGGVIKNLKNVDEAIDWAVSFNPNVKADDDVSIGSLKRLARMRINWNMDSKESFEVEVGDATIKVNVMY